MYLQHETSYYNYQLKVKLQTFYTNFIKKTYNILCLDFDECSDSKFHDCSDNAKCFNLHGTYTCSCKDGFSDLSHNTQFPGRVCSCK